MTDASILPGHRAARLRTLRASARHAGSTYPAAIIRSIRIASGSVSAMRVTITARQYSARDGDSLRRFLSRIV